MILEEAVKTLRFDRLGCFTYSKEEGTPAEKFENQIHPRTKQKRRNIIMNIQNEISKEKMNDFRKMVSSIDYEDYDSSKDYTNIIYIVELEKAIYDSSIIKNQELNNITIKILTGEY